MRRRDSFWCSLCSGPYNTFYFSIIAYIQHHKCLHSHFTLYNSHRRVNDPTFWQMRLRHWNQLNEMNEFGATNFLLGADFDLFDTNIYPFLFAIEKHNTPWITWRFLDFSKKTFYSNKKEKQIKTHKME